MQSRSRARSLTVRALAVALLAGAATTGAAPPAGAETPRPDPRHSTPAASGSKASFANPALADRPLYRFWNSGGMMTAESIAAQVAQMKAIGAGGFEANQLAGIPGLSSMPGYDAATHAFGTPEWTRAWTQLFQAGTAAGLEVSQIYTPGWSAGIQGISPDAKGTAKEITFGSATLDGGATFNGALPTAPLPTGVTKRVLQGVVAYRCTANCADGATETPVLDAASAVNLTRAVSGDTVTWTAPAGTDRYLLVASWMNGTGQTIDLAATPTPSFMVDHFSSAGASAITSYWERNVLTPQLRAAFRKSGGSLFFDSLELNHQDKQIRHWTDDFLSQFQKRRGYSLVPYLAAVATSTPQFDFAGGVGGRVRQDYTQTLSELFVAHHIEPLKAWAHRYGLMMRGQAYSSWGPTPLDYTDAATALDIPEQEANNRSTATNPLFGTAGSDTWRQVVSANAMAGRSIVSWEAGTFGREDGLARQSLVAKLNSQFSLGVNKVIYHGWADQSPGTATTWPGYYPFRNYVGDVYGPQTPFSVDDTTINDYVGRVQRVLRRGTLASDVAVFWDRAGDAQFDDTTLADAGYSYGFVNNTLVTKASSRVRNDRVTRLGYRAIVVDALGDGANLDLATAKRLLGWARQGLPIVVVGDPSDQVNGYHPGQDAAMARTIERLLAARSVVTVSSRTKALGALRSLGVNPDASYDSEPLRTLHRTTKDSDYYFLFNSSTERTSTTVTLKGRGVPYRYNAWTGAVTPIAEYSRTRSGVRVPVDLATGQGELIALTRGNADTPRTRCTPSALSTTADELVVGSGSSLLMRDAKAGRYSTRLADGRRVISTIDTVAAPVTPQSWTLNVTSWHAGASPSETAKTALDEIMLTTGSDKTLPSWQKIDGLANSSGTAVYSTKLDVGPAWTGGTGAYLDLGQVLGTAQVSVNGRQLPALDQVGTGRIDLGGYLNAGSNTIEVRIATPVNNAGFGTKDAYGLVGPVTLTPYGQASIQVACRR